MEKGKLRFVTEQEAEVDQQATRLNLWLSKPGLTEAEQLMLVRVHLAPGDGHAFHRHPELEEIIYVLNGTAEQWVGEECRMLGPGEMAHIPRDVIHATHNGGEDTLEMLAIISPATHQGPFAVDVFHEEPWRSLRASAPVPAASDE